jgi:flagellar P-ring protein FlgI
VLLLALLAQSPLQPTASRPAPPPALEVQIRYPEGIPTPIGDLVDVRNIRSNKIFNFGIVTGLLGTGDTSNFAKQQIASVAAKLGLTVSSSDINANNVAIVSVDAVLPPYAQSGQSIDCFVSSYGDAKSLQGGRLLRTPLYGADDQRAIAVASGPLVLGGFSAAGQAASVQKNHTTAGMVPAGAQVEDYGAMAAPMRPVSESGVLHLDLREQEATLATRIAEAINGEFSAAAAAVTPGTVRVTVPPDRGETTPRFVPFLAQILEIRVVPVDRARVVVDEKTSMVLVTGAPRLGPCLISRGNLTITIAETPEVSQPAPFSDEGETTVVPRTDLQATEDRRALTSIAGAATLAELAEALNALGATPRELIDILSKLHSAGALRAQLVVH